MDLQRKNIRDTAFKLLDTAGMETVISHLELEVTRRYADGAAYLNEEGQNMIVTM